MPTVCWPDTGAFVAVAQILKWKTIPAGVRRNLTERQARILNFTENLERKDLNPLERPGVRTPVS